MKKAVGHCRALAMLAVLAGCSHQTDEQRLVGTWTNRHVAVKRPALVSIEFLPQNTATITAIDALAAAGWHPQTTSTAQYAVIAPGKLKITEELGSVALDYRIDDTRLVLSGHGLAQLLGRDEPPQTLDKSD